MYGSPSTSLVAMPQKFLHEQDVETWLHVAVYNSCKLVHQSRQLLVSGHQVGTPGKEDVLYCKV